MAAQFIKNRKEAEHYTNTIIEIYKVLGYVKYWKTDLPVIVNIMKGQLLCLFKGQPLERTSLEQVAL